MCRAGSRARSIRVFPNGTHEPYASDLGIACGLAFDRRGCTVCRRSIGHGLRRGARQDRPCAIATLPPSVAAFHLAVGPDDCVYVSASDAGPVRSRLPRRPGDGRDRQDVFGLRTTARDCVRLAGCALRDGGARGIERALPCAGPTAAPSWSCRGSRSSGSRSIRTAGWSWRRTTRLTGSMCRYDRSASEPGI